MVAFFRVLWLETIEPALQAPHQGISGLSAKGVCANVTEALFDTALRLTGKSPGGIGIGIPQRWCAGERAGGAVEWERVSQWTRRTLCRAVWGCGASEQALRTGSQGTSVVTAEGAYANATEERFALTSVALQP